MPNRRLPSSTVKRLVLCPTAIPSWSSSNPLRFMRRLASFFNSHYVNRSSRDDQSKPRFLDPSTECPQNVFAGPSPQGVGDRLKLDSCLYGIRQGKYSPIFEQHEERKCNNLFSDLHIHQRTCYMSAILYSLGMNHPSSSTMWSFKLPKIRQLQETGG